LLLARAARPEKTKAMSPPEGADLVAYKGEQSSLVPQVWGGERRGSPTSERLRVVGKNQSKRERSAGSRKLLLWKGVEEKGVHHRVRSERGKEKRNRLQNI